MTKLEFQAALAGRLTGLPDEERQKSIDFYMEMIDDRLEEGMSEEEAVASLEPVEVIAREILCDQPLGDLLRARASGLDGGKKRSALQTTLLILGFPLWFPLLLTAVILVLCLYLIIWCLIVVVYAVVAALGLSALAAVVAGFVFVASHPASCLFCIGVGAVLAGLCIFAFFGSRVLSLWLIQGTVRLGRWIKSLLIRKERS